jgi:aminoglycoside phosphotransferase (APT) family kinase protein
MSDYNRLKELFPNEQITFGGEGWSSCAYSVGDNIIRIQKQGNVSPCKKEARVLEFLNDKVTACEIPQVKVVLEPFPYSIHKKLLGNNWNINGFGNLNEKKKDLFAGDSALFLAQIHSVKLNELKKFIRLSELELPNYSHNDFIRTFESDFKSDEIDKIYDFFIEVSNNKKDIVLIHGDFWEANALVNDNYRLKCVFDFGNAVITNREMEFKCISENSEYSDLYKRILKEYEKILNIKVDVDMIDKLYIRDCLDCIIFMANNGRKEENPTDWLRYINILHDFLLRGK